MEKKGIKPTLKENDEHYPIYNFKTDHWDKDIESYRGSFDTYVTGWIMRFERAVESLGDEAYDKIGYILDPFIMYASKQIEKLCDMVAKEIGEIKVDHAIGDCHPFSRNDPLGVVLGPKVDKAKSSSNDQESAEAASKYDELEVKYVKLLEENIAIKKERRDAARKKEGKH